MRGVLVVSFLIVIGCTTTRIDVGSDGGEAGTSGGSGGTAGTMGAGGATGSGGASGRGGGALDGGSQVTGPIVRTYAYHQISLLTTKPTARSMISANGTKIVYPVAPGTGDLATPNRIFVINPDGTGNVEVDAYKTNCFCNSQVVISGDGQIVASTDSTQVRAAGADASKKGAVTFDSGEISDLAISGDGAKVFMIHRRDNAVTGGMRLERGLWTMGADGGGLTQLAGATSVAPLFTVTPDQVFPFNGCGKSLDVSADGRRVVIALQVGGSQYALVNESGGTWRRIKGPVQFVYQVAISSDGSKVAVWTQQPGDLHEISVMSFDGTGSRVITTQSQGSCFATMTLNADGSQLLAADTGMLFSTTGADPITLHMVTAGDGNGVGAPGSISPWFTMTADAKRFGYYNADAAGMVQLALLQINPASLGASPSVSSPILSTASIPRDRSLGATVSCKISGGGTLVRAGTAVLLNGVEDRSGSWVNGQLFLRDDGMKGDPVANDGAFTSDGTINAGTGAEVGPRIVRAKAEATAADGRRHATAIDISGLEVK